MLAVGMNGIPVRGLGDRFPHVTRWFLVKAPLLAVGMFYYFIAGTLADLGYQISNQTGGNIFKRLGS